MRCSRRFLCAKVTELLYDGECQLTRVKGERVGLLSLNRPARRNSIGRTLLQELHDRIEYCSNPANEIRCLVLASSVTGVFCAGSDLKERRSMSVDESRIFVQRLRDTFNELEDLSIPTIAAIEGKALGGGCELALCADIRVAGADAVFGLPETSLAIIPGAGGTYRVPRVMGYSRALELILTAESINAARALQCGLVNEVTPAGAAVEAALRMAQRIASNGPIAVAAAKAAVRGGYGQTRDVGMAAEARQYDVVLQTQDRLEGLRAFAEKRPPQYEGK
ncbi:enoyl-CoA hydratase/isomerase family protein [Trypanosoma theileri]|uniref:Enoyl-CoA hydratase/isomerase family protein n=1 Tax=Trypanosoma theileri TaxID=67003 RepID=A0A1X0NJ83_9TRYP|nr:enoyl-CoA hydratase/isomerase family protein [Trypanosoma theileri]ORC84697.1 enoyl-CoA hydratase/isomerase family protein [Trypanosoma theileri]